MKFRFTVVSLSFILFVLIFLSFWWQKISNYEKTDNAYVRGSITNISSRISGYVESVPGVLNTKVQKGDLIVSFEKGPFQAKYDLALSELQGAKAKIDEINALINSANVKIDEKKLSIELSNTKIESAHSRRLAESSNLKLMTEEKNRMNKLLEKKTISKARFDKAKTNYEKSLYKVKQLESDIKALNISHQVIKKELNQIKIDLKKLMAQKLRIIAQKDALNSKMRTAEIDLQSTTIKAPITGVIANRIVEPGVYMKKGWPLMSIVPTEDVWVIANFKETQIKKIKAGQKVLIKIDAFPEIIIEGKVLSISPASAASFSILPPQNASGNFVKVVQRIPVKITFELPEKYIGKVVPGLSVVAKVITGERN